MLLDRLSQALGSYRAENLDRGQLFELYTAPSYFPELLQSIPCFLQGGRGTGKTTALKYMSYEGDVFGCGPSQPFHGVYIKFVTTETSAFRGGDLSEESWTKIFCHYINLIQCDALLEYINLAFHDRFDERDVIQFKLFERSLNIGCSSSINDVRLRIAESLIDLQLSVNSIQDSPKLLTSTLLTPLKLLIKSLDAIMEFKGKPVAFLFDEYEVLDNYQQRVVNTLVKQADSRLTYKIGVREEVLRERVVVGGGEEIRTPADYALVNIEERLKEAGFGDFALKVLTVRMKPVFDELGITGVSLEDLFPSLSVEEEAILLGVREEASVIRNRHPELCDTFQNISDFDLFMANFLSESRNRDISHFCQIATSGGDEYRNLVNNYGYASLFTLKRKKPGLTKYYCGWQTLLMLSNGNIRYLLQLVSTCLRRQVQQEPDRLSPVSEKNQTECCAEVGSEILRDSEGISKSGARLMKLVLALGQVFHQLAVTPEGHAPEITQFEISDEATADPEALESVRALIRDAIMHMALVKVSGTKLGGAADTRTYDYMLHPIFSAFFRYSIRSKRKAGIKTEELLGMISNPKQTISKVLSRHHRTWPEVLPEQLQLFGGFYEAD